MTKGKGIGNNAAATRWVVCLWPFTLCLFLIANFTGQVLVDQIVFWVAMVSGLPVLFLLRTGPDPQATTRQGDKEEDRGPDTGALFASMEIFRVCADNAGYGVAVVGLTGRVDYCNNYFAKIHGWDQAEVLGSDYSVFHSPAQTNRMNALFREVRDNDRVSEKVIDHHHREGFDFTMSMDGMLARDQNKVARFIVFSAHDVSERQALEVTLAEREVLLERAGIEHSQVLVELDQVFDSTTGAMRLISPGGKTLKVNQAFADLVGLTKEECKYRNCEDLQSCVVCGTDQCVRNQIFQGVQAVTLEVERFMPGGEVGIFRLEGRSFKSGDGTVIGVIEQLEDITRHHMAEQELEDYRQALGRRTAELEEYTKLASHDLQEPLRKLISFSEILQQDLAGQLDPDSAENLDFIIRAASRIKALVGDMLILSRSSQAALNTMQISMEKAAAVAISSLAGRIEKQNAKVHLPTLPDVEADGEMIVNLYRNLIDNALKFNMAAEVDVWLTLEMEGDIPVFGVKDNGIGIKEEYRETVFSPFKRLHGKHKFGGTGVGLALCRRVVERHGGNIWIESATEGGTHIKFTLPREKELIDV